MNVDAITSFSSLAQTLPSSQSIPISFSDWLSDKAGGINQDLLKADAALQTLAQGESSNLHETMLSLEQAKLSFKLALQIRNRLLGAYQDLMREQF